MSKTAQRNGSDPYKVNSLIIGPEVDPTIGTVCWDAARSLWNGGILLAALVFAPVAVTWGAFAVFLLLSAATLCAGHSVGFHRRLIHRSFDCPKWVERTLVEIGTLVGMGGPLWTIRTHDTRDWAQRQPRCHNFLAHRHGLLKDGWWNLHCRLVFAHPPGFDPGPGIADDAFYRFIQRTWMLHQLPVGLVLYALGGWPWVVWGVFVRVAACTTMHWFISYFAHTRGPMSWQVDGAGVQAHDVPIAAIPTMGESWHNNHHAFPASARHGLYPGQPDPGYRFVQLLEWLGLAWDVNTPEKLPPRPGITALRPEALNVAPRGLAVLARR
ncbi:MAG TPA: acyl-CoA desaturase [Stellaceae bacterium]